MENTTYIPYETTSDLDVPHTAPASALDLVTSIETDVASRATVRQDAIRATLQSSYDVKEEVYVEYPRLFGPKSGTDKVLHLLKSLYGLRQVPRKFFEKLKAGLEERGWNQSDIDPCLFLKLGMIYVVYVDDTIFASAHIKDLEKEIASLGISIEGQ